MIAIDKNELLSETERKLLEQDAGLLKKVVRFGSIIIPGLIFFTIFGWMNGWHGLFLFLGTTLSFAGTIALAGSFAQVYKLKADLRSNIKTISRFIIDQKIIEGYVSSPKRNSGGINGQKVKRKITIADNNIRDAINYKIEKQKNTGPFNDLFFSDIDPYREILRYKYTFKLKPEQENKVTDFIIPVDYYLIAKEGETVNISYAKKSKKVFKVEKAF